MTGAAVVLLSPVTVVEDEKPSESGFEGLGDGEDVCEPKFPGGFLVLGDPEPFPVLEGLES